MKQKNLRKREKTDLFKTNYKLCFPTANNLCKNPLIFVNSAEESCDAHLFVNNGEESLDAHLWRC